MKKNLGIIGGIFLVICILWINKESIVRAAAPYFIRVYATATATTSPVYMSPGKSTTTPIIDVYAYGVGIGEAQGDMDLRLALQFTGSSTASILNFKTEYANGSNCSAAPLGCDWYQEANQTTGVNATTTLITPVHVNSIYAASTTIGNANVADNRTMTIIRVPIHSRFVRPVFTIPIGAGNGSLYVEVLGVSPRQ